MTHNCSGFNKDIVNNILKNDFDIVCFQETHHLPSAKYIFDSSNKYKTYHASAMDENIANPTKRGGLITYISTKIQAETSFYKSGKSYLITITGSVVIINLYLPQQNLFDNGLYEQDITEIYSIIEALGNKYAFIILGDFNSNGRNLREFLKFIEKLKVENWSKDIDFTYSQHTRGGMCATKLDHILAKNTQENALIECKIDNSLITKGGHKAITAKAKLLHLKIDKQDDNEDVSSSTRPIYINFDKIEDDDLNFFQKDCSKLIEEFSKNPPQPFNPIAAIKMLFDEIGKLAEVILPQKTFKFPGRPKPGWTKYVKQANIWCNQAEKLWTESGRSHGTTEEQNYIDAKNYKNKCIRVMKDNTQKSIAEAMVDDLTSSGKSDKSRAWKPIRSVIKGNTCINSPIINNLKSSKAITQFWSDFYRGKMKGQTSPSDKDWFYIRDLANKPSKYVTIEPKIVKQPCFMLRTEGAYYDPYSAKLLKILPDSFHEVFASWMTLFINIDPNEQSKFLENTNHFFLSYIRPILKGSTLNATLPKSYRPISVSHTLTMLLERVIQLSGFNNCTPCNFYGYIKERSCEIAVQTLKDIISTVDINNLKLALLDASGAFESVIWNKIFPKMAINNNPRIIQLIWQMYRFNRYEIRWNGCISTQPFYATQGTKQGGILSGMIFLEYMNILKLELEKCEGLEFNGLKWNSLFYADDVTLIGLNKRHLQKLLDICQKFENDGYVKWNASKSVVLSLTSKKFERPKPDALSDFMLYDQRLPLKGDAKLLGYRINQRLDDSDMINYQAKRLYALTNNICRGIPLHLLDDSRLRKIICAYTNIYMLPIFDNCTKATWQKLKTAHRYSVMTISQFKFRDKKNWDPDHDIFCATNHNIYGRLNLKLFDTRHIELKEKFKSRYMKYLSTTTM